MASLMIQDAFEPYYAGRDDAAGARAKPRQPPTKRSERASESEIVLPCEAPPPAAEVRRDRRVIAH